MRVRSHVDTTVNQTDDRFDQAQIQFGNVAYPKIGAAVEGQLDAQRRFGEVARPPVLQTQKNIDDAQLKARKGAPLPK